MSEQRGGRELAAGTTELLSPIRFQEELRRVVRFRPRLPVGDPLDAAVRRIEQNPALAQSRLLTRILAALIYQQGEFRRAGRIIFRSRPLRSNSAARIGRRSTRGQPGWIVGLKPARQQTPLAALNLSSWIYVHLAKRCFT